MSEGYSPPTAPDLYVDERLSVAPLPGADDLAIDHDEPATRDVAKDKAADVGQAAAGAGQHVANVAKEQSVQVASEAGQQAKELLTQAQAQAKEQAAVQQERAVGGLRTLSSELASMSKNADNPGVASDLARQAAERTSAVAGWLDGREPAAVLDDLTAFARRRPVAFLAIAGGVGFLAGRLTRGLKAQADSADSTQPSSDSTPAYANGAGSYSPAAGVAPAGAAAALDTPGIR